MNTQRGRGERRGTSSDKTLLVMDLFTAERPEWTVEEACAVLGQSESTIYRYFRSLSAAGLIFSVRSGRYLLGPGIVHYDRQLRTSDPLMRASEPTFQEMAQRYSGPGLVFVCRIYRDQVMSMHEHRLGALSGPEGTFARGRLVPLLRGAPALAMLAFMEVRTARAIFSRVGGDEGQWLEIKRQMRAIRALGYAVGRDDPDPGTTHISVPLMQDGGVVAGSLTLALATSALDENAVAQAGEIMKREAVAMADRARTSARP